jgi:hypothetical protein
MHPIQTHELVRSMFDQGVPSRRISLATGIPRSTIRGWRRDGFPTGGHSVRQADCPSHGGEIHDQQAYAYLLGLYLGDGCLSKHARTYALRITLDRRYPGIIEEARRAIASMRPTKTRLPGLVSKVGCLDVCSYWQHWPCVLPHGPGRKHERRIELDRWQRDLVTRHPQQMLRGLIHSDGCRSINKVHRGRYEYPRYLFSNHSEDILEIFAWACDLVGVRYRRSCPTVISVARRDCVRRLDTFIGPKS